MKGNFFGNKKSFLRVICIWIYVPNRTFLPSLHAGTDRVRENVECAPVRTMVLYGNLKANCSGFSHISSPVTSSTRSYHTRFIPCHAPGVLQGHRYRIPPAGIPGLRNRGRYILCVKEKRSNVPVLPRAVSTSTGPVR
jgi:hypothetical protein